MKIVLFCAVISLIYTLSNVNGKPLSGFLTKAKRYVLDDSRPLSRDLDGRSAGSKDSDSSEDSESSGIINDCGSLSIPANGTVNETGTTYLETATYNCNIGFEQTGGDLTRTCQADGTWSGSELVCTIADCGSLCNPANGIVTETGTTYLETATYNCSIGYEQTGGDLTRTCQADGTWSGSELVCTIADCGSLSNPANGIVTETGTMLLETATYNCSIGYEQTGGDLTRTCQADGTWSGSELVCTIADCGFLCNPANGIVTETGTTYLETATYNCSIGYEQTGGDLTRTCQADGTWSGSELVCTIADCGSLSNPANGIVTETGTMLLETATYNCNTGFEQTGGDLTRTCQADGTWSGSELVCTITDCGSLSNPANGTVTETGTTYLETATYNCSIGFEQTGGDLTRTCQADGTWSGSELVCTIAACPNGWRQNGTSCYKLFQNSVTWDAARTGCQLESSYLAEVTSPGELEFIYFALPIERAWIGLNDISNEGIFVWVNSGNPVSFENWGPYEPSNYNSLNDCVYMYYSPSNSLPLGWGTYQCNQYNNYICELQAII